MENTISEKCRFELLKNYFEEKGLVGHQIETFNDYINNGIQRVVKEADIIVQTKEQKYTISFGEVHIPNPSVIEEDRSVRLIYPDEARRRDLNYDSPVFVDIIEKLEIENQEPEITHHRRVIIGRTPIMLNSVKCNLHTLTKQERNKKGECEWDNGGYFIIRGKERVLVGQLRGVYNQPIVLLQKPGERFKYVCETRSMSEETGHSVLLQVKIGVDNRTIVFSLPNIKEYIPVGIVFKALGFTSEEDIINIIGLYNKETERYIKFIIRDSYFIKTQEDALKYIGQFAMHIIKDDKRLDYALQIVENELLPHMGVTSTIKEKVYYIGSMVNKLLMTHVGLRKEDDRDNYINKRVEMAGVLCCDLFRALFKRFVKSIQLQIEKKKQQPDIVSTITKTTSITLGLKHSFCFPAGTLVTMANGLSIPIEKLLELSNENEKVLGWNGNGLIPTKHGGLSNQGLKDTIKLTFENGKTLICTPDHKILVLNADNTKELVEANNIPLDSKIVYGVEFPKDDFNEDLNNKWYLETYNGLKSEKWTVDSYENRNKTLALMRILGFIICDGHIPEIKNNQAQIYLGNMFDINTFIEDYMLVSENNIRPKINDNTSEKWGLSYSIRLCSKLTNLLRNISGIVIGRKVNQERTIPGFLLDDNCPKSILREFLGGLFGGDGHSPKLDIRKGERTCIDGVALSWTTESKNLDYLLKTFNNIQNLLSKLGVNNSYINGPYKPSSGPEDRFYYILHLPSNTSFNNNVGFRYCIHKSYKLNIASLYWEFEEKIKKQHSFIINTVNNLKNSQPITIKNALDIARNELIEKEYIINNYYSLSSVRDVMKRREKGRSTELQYLQKKYGVPDAKDFIDNIGALYMFQGEYISDRKNTEIPCFYLKLVDKRNHEKQIVYDITNVDICKTFLAAGLVVSNSTGNWGIQKNNYIRTGVSQVLSRMTHGAVISHLRRVVIPIGREGKNAKIRQIHSSQINYICPCECFDPETPILTWEGEVKLAKDIKVGDVLIDDKGNPTKVKKTISGIAPMYEVNIVKPNFLNHTVTSNHILTLKIRQHNRIRYIRKKNRSPYYEVQYLNKDNMKMRYVSFKTENEAMFFSKEIEEKYNDIIDLSISDYNNLSGPVKERLVIFKCNNINWEKENVLIDPYILGLWLGDGFKTGFGFASADKELVNKWKDWGHENGADVKHHHRYAYGISSHDNNINNTNKNPAPLKSLLKKYNLVHNKHIPTEYLINDRETRLKILAGLIDTDGHVRSDGHEIRICQGPKNSKIIENTVFLAHSLGFSVHKNDGISQWTHEKTGEKRKGIYEEVYITGEYLYEIPTVLNRKKLNIHSTDIANYRSNSFIQSKFQLISKDLGPFVGWQLEGNGRFLLPDCTVVHNTPEGLNWPK